MTEPPVTASIVVAIVNYCTAELTIDCLRSLSLETVKYPNLRVYVADNASPDGSGPAIAGAIQREGWSSWATVVHNARNGGFAYGNNTALRAAEAAGATADFVWLLNSDTVLRAGALQALLGYMAEHPEVGICGSRLEHPDGTRQSSSFRFHSILSEFEASLRLGVVTRLLRRWAVAPPRGDEPELVDWLAGASMLIRSDVIAAIGLLDEAYFLYFEETDFCRRSRDHGFLTAYVPASRVVHLVGQSTGVTSGPPRRRPSYWFQSRRRYFLRHHGAAYAAAADVALTVGTAVGHARDVALRRPRSMPEKFLGDLIRHSFRMVRSSP